MNAALTHSYNLARLGHVGDTVRFEAGAEERAAIVDLAGALSLHRFAVQVELKRLSPSRFLLDYLLDAEVTQACVVTLEPVAARIERAFRRELHFGASGRHAPRSDAPPEALDLSGQDPEAADEQDEISSLHFDLGGPALEEFLLALDTYPRRDGAAFEPGEEAQPGPESPFAVLKSVKSSK